MVYVVLCICNHDHDDLQSFIVIQMKTEMALSLPCHVAEIWLYINVLYIFWGFLTFSAIWVPNNGSNVSQKVL